VHNVGNELAESEVLGLSPESLTGHETKLRFLASGFTL